MFTFQQTETKHPGEWERQSNVNFSPTVTHAMRHSHWLWNFAFSLLRWSSSEDRKCSSYNSLIQTVVFCCNLLTHDRKGHRWREAMRLPVVQDCLCRLVSGHFAPPTWAEHHVTWLSVHVFTSHKERPWVIELLAETIQSVWLKPLGHWV